MDYISDNELTHLETNHNQVSISANLGIGFEYPSDRRFQGPASRIMKDANATIEPLDSNQNRK